MRRLLIVALAVLILSALPSAPLVAADGCQFVLGFKTLRDRIPDVVGECRASEHHDPLNGDGLQETSAWHGQGGLLVWRKADNWTAFTDGATTWINGPFGLQKRQNDQRFDWESAAQPAPTAPTAPTVGTPCAIGESDVRYLEEVPQSDGSTIAYWAIQNRCDRPTNLTLDGRLLATGSGPPLADAPTAHLVGLAPGSASRVGLRFPTRGGNWFSWRVATADASSLCGGPSGAWPVCVAIDPWLAGPLAELMQVPGGEWLVKVAAEHGVRIRRGELPVGAIGMYDQRSRTVTIDRRLDSYSSWARAAVLAHELQHAADDAAGLWPTSTEACYQAEETAFSRQAAVWLRFWHGNLPREYTVVHAEFNEITRTVANDPVGFSIKLLERYAADCGAE